MSWAKKIDNEHEAKRELTHDEKEATQDALFEHQVHGEDGAEHIPNNHRDINHPSRLSWKISFWTVILGTIVCVGLLIWVPGVLPPVAALTVFLASQPIATGFRSTKITTAALIVSIILYIFLGVQIHAQLNVCIYPLCGFN